MRPRYKRLLDQNLARIPRAECGVPASRPGSRLSDLSVSIFKRTFKSLCESPAPHCSFLQANGLLSGQIR